MPDEPKTGQDEAEVEAHIRPTEDPGARIGHTEDPGARIGRSEDPGARVGRSDEDEAEVEAHHWPRVGSPPEDPNARIG